MNNQQQDNKEEAPLGLITGGTRGIGFAIAIELAKSGYNLILGFNSDQTRAEKAKSILVEQYGVEIYTVKGDVADESTIDAYFETVKQCGNKLTAFVHNAGLQLGITTEAASDKAKQVMNSKSNENTEMMDFSSYDYYQQVYPKCFITCAEKAIKLMEDGKGYIISISSVGCNTTMTPRLGYEIPGQAKCVMEFLTRYYALRLAPRKITCNVVIPGLVMTDAWDRLYKSSANTAEALKKRVDATPMQRWGAAEEVGQTVAFLCSRSGSFITGIALPVDGGLHLQ